jgi:hypothetical protein
MRISIPAEKEREIAPPGSHYAVCCTVVDLGSQSGQYGIKHQLYVGWELSEELTSRGKPHVLGKFYSLTADARGALREDLESWFGKPLDSYEISRLNLVDDLLGRTCTLGVLRDVGKDGKPQAAITSVMLPAKGKPAKTVTASDPIVFGFEDFDRRAYESLPQWLQNIVSRSPEYRRAVSGDSGTTKERLDEKLNGGGARVPADNDLDDELPF